MMRRLILLLLLAVPSWGAQSLVMSAGKYASVTLNASPFLDMGSWRIEFRLHDWTNPGSGASRHIFGLTSEKFFGRLYNLSGTTYLSIRNIADTCTDGCDPFISMTGRTDIVVRVQRNATSNIYSVEVWNADGSSRAVGTKTIGTIGDFDMGTLHMPISWYTSVAGKLAYWRMYSTLVDLNSTPPGTEAGGDLLDYEFEGNGNDGSANEKDLAFNGGAASYDTTPAFLPGVTLPADFTARAAVASSLTVSNALCDGGCTYLWEQTEGPNTATITSPTAATTAISNLIAGQYTFQLTVTDPAEETASDTINVGVVTTDANYVVQTGDSDVDAILGPLLMYGQSPWSWFDDRHKALADFFGGLYTTEAGWNNDDWNDALTGTVSVTYGSATVTGNGTQFQTDYCGGGTSPSGNYTIVIWYDNGGGDFGRANYGVSACPSQTSLTLSSNWTTKSGTQSSLSHARWYNYGVWIGNSTNINFYDSVLAHYALYYRTGLTVYRDYARTLADRWYTMPYIDAGRRGRLMNPRNMAISGLVLRALDGKSEYWVGIRKLLDSYASGFGGSSLIADIREQGYGVSAVALGALLDPDSDKRAGYVTALEREIVNRWEPQQRVDGSWDMITWGFDTWDYYPVGSTVNVTNGSTTVTLVPNVGFNSWGADDTEGAKFWVASSQAHNDRSLDDPVYYSPTWVDSTHITLDRPYEGSTAEGRGWQMQGGKKRPYLMGRATQPFQLGIAGTAWYWASLALTQASSEYADEAQQFVLDVADWLIASGYDTSWRGLYWGRNTVTCEPIANHLNDVACRCELGSCTTGDISSMRYLNAEVMRVMSAAYQLSRSATYSTHADILFGAMWGRDGGPEADSYYNSEYVDGGWTFSTKKAKNLGFAFGFGAGATWPAARTLSSPSATDWMGISGSISISGYIDLQ